MLKQRVLTALWLLPLALVIIFLLSPGWFLLLVAVILLGGSWEYGPLAGLSNLAGRSALVLLQVLVMFALFLYRDDWNSGALLYMSLACAAWLLVFLRLPMYRPGHQPGSSYRITSFITALASVTAGWFALGWIRGQNEGSWLVLLLLLIVWAADTGAYFAGKSFGKAKLAPNISPGKTRAGLYGGLLAAPLVAMLAAALMPMTAIAPSRLILLALVTTLASVGGDLVISLHKRTSGQKDSGSLLPGHGGILDRVDSLLAAAPFFALGLLVLTGINGF
jgi:phosphatidate cytidylyltransferase